MMMHVQHINPRSACFHDVNKVGLKRCANLCCSFRNAFRYGTGTKTTMALRPPFTSTSLAELNCKARNSIFNSGTLASRSRKACATEISTSSGGESGALATRRILDANAAADDMGRLLVLEGERVWISGERPSPD